MKAVTSIMIAGTGFALDRISKDIVEYKLKNKKLSLLKGKLKIERASNEGFAMNSFDSNRSLVVIISEIVFFFLMSFNCIVLAVPRLKPLRLGFAILSAGAAGNIYDRVVKEYVVDFINADVPILRRIIFNLADIYIVVGGLIAIFSELTIK